MDLYFLISGTLAILFAFGVFEKTLKINKLNRFFVVCFLLLTCVFDAIGNINILNVTLSLNLILYMVVFVILFVLQKNLKSFIATVLTSLIIVAVFYCYNALNMETFEFAYVKPYVYLALVLGFVLYTICPSMNSTFCGTLLGSIVFELTFFQMSFKVVEQTLMLGGDFTIAFTLYVTISYGICSCVSYMIKKIKSKKQEKVKTSQN